jgi:hypothetical protein
MRADEHRLIFVVADHPKPQIALVLVKIRLELRSKGRVADAVDVPLETLITQHHHPPAGGAEVRVIVGPVEEIRDAVVLARHTEESTHVGTLLLDPGKSWRKSVLGTLSTESEIEE